MDRFEQQAYELVTGDAAREAFDIAQEDAEDCATATAGTPGARARCWPGGWSKPARRSSPSTSAAGTITGICKAATNTTCRRSISCVSALFTDLTERGLSREVAASCCAASSAARRG